MSIKTLTEQILQKMSSIGKVQYKFLINLFDLWLGIQGRYNFTNLSRYGKYHEQSYRNQFSEQFDFIEFNGHLAKDYLSTNRILTFDPFHVSKSGKCTKGVGYYYSGCAGRLKWGLEFSGIGAVDLSTKTAIHLGAFQTLDAEKGKEKNRLTYYANHLINHKTSLQEVSTQVVADAYFSKSTFVNALTSAGYDLITRLRKDAHIRYLYQGKRTGKPGRPKQFDGKIEPLNLRMDYFNLVQTAADNSWKAYEATVNIKAWKRSVKLVVVQHFDEQEKIKKYQLFVSTNLTMNGQAIKKAYNYRFQSEFVFRDGKQFAGLNHCQARSEEKLHFHVNTALTIVSLAKITQLIKAKKENEQDKPFSMANFKTSYTNGFIFNRIISMFGFNPNSKKIKFIREKITAIGKIAA
jgi:hypothetical protein